VNSRAAERAFGLSGAQVFVLHKLAESKDRSLSLNELAEKTLTHQSSVSVVVSRLVEKSLVSRSTSKEDSRKIEIKLTSEGKKILKSTPEAAQERLIAGITQLSKTEQQKLSELLKTLIENSGLQDQVPSLFFEEEKK
jgi:DNA-binding MarR family transcriptional regulator